MAEQLRRAGLLEPGRVFEVRALGVSLPSYRRRHIRAGYYDYDHLDDACAEALNLEADAAGIYVTLNPTKADLLARRANRIDVAESGDQTSDGDIDCRRLVLIDADPIRPKGISATDAEKAKAREVILAVRDFLLDSGFPPVVLADSGNGYHLLIRVNLPNDDNSRELTRRFLAALASKFDSPDVKIDQAVFNSARITKLYGTLARKGDSTADRPHRRSSIIEAPERTGVAPRELIEKMAGDVTQPENKHVTPTTRCDGSRNGHYAHRLDVEKFLKDRGIEFTIKAAQASLQRTVYVLKECPFDKAHGGTQEVCVMQGPDGKLAFLCMHDSCRGRGWQEFKAAVGKPDDHHYDPPLSGAPHVDSPRNGSLICTGTAGSETSDGPVLEDDDDPHRLGRRFLDGYRAGDGRLRLRFWQGEYWDWRGGAYRSVPAGDVRGRLVASVKDDFDRIAAQRHKEWSARAIDQRPTKGSAPPKTKKVSSTLITNTLQAVASMTLVPGDKTPPVWLTGDGPNPRDLVICQNAIVNLPARADGADGAILAPTPDLFALSAANIAFDARAPKPLDWLRFLAELWPNDVESRDALREWFGYLLTPATSQQKILLIVGPPRSGKGTIGRVLTGLIGEANVAGPTLSSLGTNFGLWPLIDKSAAIISDARLGGRSDLAVITERLLSISGEDAQTIDRKNLPPVTMRLPTRFILLTNEMPRIIDSSGALASRFIVLRLTNTFYGREDKDLTPRLLQELPGIMLWAIEGWRMLRDRGRFRQPESALADIQDLEDLGSPVRAFVRDCCTVDEAQSVRVQDLFGAWRRWCEAGNKRESGTVAAFGRDLKAAFPLVESARPREGDGRPRVYRGIALLADSWTIPGWPVPSDSVRDASSWSANGPR